MSESLDKATPLELDMLILQKKISQGDFENIEFDYELTVILVLKPECLGCSGCPFNPLLWH